MFASYCKIGIILFFEAYQNSDLGSTVADANIFDITLSYVDGTYIDRYLDGSSVNSLIPSEHTIKAEHIKWYNE